MEDFAAKVRRLIEEIGEQLPAESRKPILQAIVAGDVAALCAVTAMHGASRE